jgi:hypothetical protein
MQWSIHDDGEYARLKESARMITGEDKRAFYRYLFTSVYDGFPEI